MSRNYLFSNRFILKHSSIFLLFRELKIYFPLSIYVGALGGAIPRFTFL